MRRSLAVSLLSCLALAACAVNSPQLQPDSHELTVQQALAQLDALPVPAGADPARFEELRSALRIQLEHADISKWTSAEPTDAANKVGDFYLTRIDDQTATAHWTYKNVGDYDQNGVVSISDLSTLGANLGKNTSSSDWAQARFADGDLNGEVNIADLTPLGSHLLNTVTGYSIQLSTPPGDEFSWVELVNVPTSMASGSFNQPRVFEVVVPAAAGQVFRVVPTDTSRGIASDPYTYDGIGGPPQLSWEAHDAVMNAIVAKYGDLQGATSEEQDAELAAFIGTQPNVADSGVLDGGGGAWGVFSDGRGFVALKNRDAGSGGMQLAAPPSFPGGKSASLAAPFGNEAVLIDAFTQLEPHETAEPEVGAMLMKKGYTPEYKEGSLAEFAALGAANGPAVVLWDGHGVATPWLGNIYDFEYDYYTGSTTVPTKELDEQYTAMLWDCTLIEGVVPIVGSPYAERRYFFNGDFIRRSGVTLAPDSLVFLNTCWGAAQSGQDFREALFEAGAGLVIAWDRNVSDGQANTAAAEFFDDTLGLEDGPAPQDPPQRPFDYLLVMDDMHARGVSGIAITPKEHCQLQRFYPIGWDFSDGNGQLAPTIRTLSQSDLVPGDDGESMYILGMFGNQPGKVYCDGSEVTYTEWLWNRIQVPLPSSGLGSSGTYEVASANGVRSNPMRLTEWRGQVDFQQDSSSHVVDGTVTTTIHLDIHLRGCVASARWVPGGPAIYPDNGEGAALWLVSDSSGTYDTYGSFTDPDSGTTTTYTPLGSTDLLWDPYYISDRYVTGSAYLKADGGLNLILGVKCPINIHGDNGDTPYEFSPSNLIFLVDGDDSFMTSTGAPNFEVLGQDWVHDDDNGTSILHQELHITTMGAINPPDPDAPR